jgi:hypothetical protein
MVFARETIESCIEEAKPLLEAHYKEVSKYQDIPLDPDYDQYFQLEKLGIIRCYVARNSDGMMIGYAVYFIRANLHYKNHVMAVQDILFVKKEYRGTGGRFILWCDEQLREDGAVVVYQHIKVDHDWSRLAERMGYEKIEYIYGKRLDLEVI